MSKQACKRVRRALNLDVNREPLPAYTWPGGYPLAYTCADNATLCAACVNKEINRVDADINGLADGWRLRDCQFAVVSVDVHWEGEPETCCHCGADIESAYGPVESDVAE